MIAVYPCPKGLQGVNCLTNSSLTSSNISVTMTVYTRQASTVCDPSNNTIISVHNLGDPKLDSTIDLTALKLAVSWLLNYTASHLPAESSIDFMFWFSPSSTYQKLWETNAYNTLQSVLAWVIWEFSTNNNENPAVAVEQKSRPPHLPSQFHTNATVSQPYTRLVLSLAMFITYATLESLLLILCWVVIIWRWRQTLLLPEISSYPLVDFASKLDDKSSIADGLSHSLGVISVESGDTTIRKELASMEVLCRMGETQNVPGQGT